MCSQWCICAGPHCDCSFPCLKTPSRTTESNKGDWQDYKAGSDWNSSRMKGAELPKFSNEYFMNCFIFLQLVLIKKMVHRVSTVKLRNHPILDLVKNVGPYHTALCNVTAIRSSMNKSVTIVLLYGIRQTYAGSESRGTRLQSTRWEICLQNPSETIVSPEISLFLKQRRQKTKDLASQFYF